MALPCIHSSLSLPILQAHPEACVSTVPHPLHGVIGTASSCCIALAHGITGSRPVLLVPWWLGDESHPVRRPRRAATSS